MSPSIKPAQRRRTTQYRLIWPTSNNNVYLGLVYLDEEQCCILYRRINVGILQFAEYAQARVSSSGVARGAGTGAMPPHKLLVNFPINLRCYVLLDCRVENVILACLKNQY